MEHCIHNPFENGVPGIIWCRIMTVPANTVTLGFSSTFMAHYDIFRDQLGIKYPAFGHALWEPNPGRLYSPVEVGDVGFIREGKFHRVFNALLPADHPSHQRFGVPEYYEPLRPSVAEHVDSGTLTPNDFCSYGVAVASGGLEVFARE